MKRASLLLALAMLGCGSKANVALSAGIQNESLAVEQKTLGLLLVGGFDLSLELGAEAEEDTTVSLESFAIARASDQSVVVPALDVSTEAQFPTRVATGSRRSVRFSLTEGKLLESAVHASICAEPVRIIGAVRDTLSGGKATPVASKPLTPSGC